MKPHTLMQAIDSGKNIFIKVNLSKDTKTLMVADTEILYELLVGMAARNEDVDARFLDYCTIVIS